LSLQRHNRRYEKEAPAVVNTAACAGCGTCAAECVFGAINMNHFSDLQIFGQIDAMLADKPRKKSSPLPVTGVPMPEPIMPGFRGCSTRRTCALSAPCAQAAWLKLSSGAASPRRSGDPRERLSYRGLSLYQCEPLDRKRVEKIKKKMEKLGINRERLQLEWISAAEGIRFATVMHRMNSSGRTFQQTRSPQPSISCQNEPLTKVNHRHSCEEL